MRPLARAKRFKTSVSDTTPDKRPDILAPGSEEADTDGEAEAEINDGVACGVEATCSGLCKTADGTDGVGGPDDDGEGESTTHILY